MALTPGFNLTEAIDLLEICSKLNNTRVPGDPDKIGTAKIDLPTVPSPDEWTSVYAMPSTSPPDHNYFEIWRSKANPNRYALGIRGTTHAKGSIIEDVRALAIAATDNNGNQYIRRPYQFAADHRATIHIGFSLGLMSIIDDIVTQMEKCCRDGATEWFITGHSQGAAVATLCRSYLAYQPLNTAHNLTYKTYVFAQPKPGDTYYGYDFEHLTYDYTRFSSMGFRITNTYDWVPEVPLSIQRLKDLSRPNVLTVNMPFKIKTRGVNPLLNIFVNALEKLNVLTSLDYVGCGTPIILSGESGENTDNPKDFFWQHHTGMYYKLLQKHFERTAHEVARVPERPVALVSVPGAHDLQAAVPTAESV